MMKEGSDSDRTARNPKLRGGRMSPKSTHREIAMISGGIPKEGNPPSKKAAKRSEHSCLAVEVMHRPLAGKPPPAIVFSSEEIKQTTNSMNQTLVISASTINTKIRRVFIDQGSSADILFRRCFDALGLSESDLEAHSDDQVRFYGEKVTPDGFGTLWVSIGNPRIQGM
ncbi:hypothetical protein PIB30_027670 [Stylosanthes scabra]|uniref:Uncharacterized protein n=1 Tax=Stylosanthes scabra TaxID=79078 RepID=A0ABU6SC84_9FABA|nr:hypothetical protein [Stylosanthes scabra]